MITVVNWFCWNVYLKDAAFTSKFVDSLLSSLFLCGNLCLCRPIQHQLLLLYNCLTFLSANVLTTFSSSFSLLISLFSWWSCIFLHRRLSRIVFGVNRVSSVHLLIELQYTFKGNSPPETAKQSVPIWFAVIVIAVISDLLAHKLTTC